MTLQGEKKWGLMVETWTSYIAQILLEGMRPRLISNAYLQPIFTPAASLNILKMVVFPSHAVCPTQVLRLPLRMHRPSMLGH